MSAAPSSPVPPTGSRDAAARAPVVARLRDSVAFLRDPGAFTAGRGRALGDYYRIRLPAYDLRVVTDPAIVEELLLTRSEDFEKSRVYWGELRRIIGQAMATLEGRRWSILRRLEQPFFTPRAVAQRLPEAATLTGLEFDELTARIGPGAELSVLEITSRLNTRLILTLLFGQAAGEERDEITARIVDGEDTIAWRSRFPWRAWTGWLNGRNLRAVAHKRFFQRYANRVESSEAAKREDLLLHALVALLEDPAGSEYPHRLLRNEMIVHLGASSETQGVAEGWCLYLLWKHPEVLARVRTEVDEVGAGGPVRADHVADLTFTTQVIRETLRIFPTAYGVVRDCVRPTKLAGESVRPGQVFFISVVGLHRNPRVWSRPDHFDPERFAPERLDGIERFHYLPFGGGRHACIGQHLALPTMVLAVAELVRRFEWTFNDSHVSAVGRATLKPRGSFRAHVRPRASSP